MKARRLVVGCSILKSELEEVLKSQDEFDVELRWLKAGYHVKADLLETRLAEALKGLEGREDEVRVLYGEKCLVDLKEAAGRMRALPTDNCLTALLGLERLRMLEAGPAMVVTPAWIRDIYFSCDPELPIWDESDFRMNFGRYERIVVLDHGLDQLADEEILRAFDLTGKILEAEAASLDRFKRLILDFLR